MPSASLQAPIFFLETQIPHSFELQSKTPFSNSIVYLSFGLLLSYPFAKLLQLHHPGFVFSMLIRSKRLITTIQFDITGKPHTLTFAPHATIKDLRSQINTKFRIRSDLHWLSCCGKPLFDFLLLEEIRGTVFMHGRLMGGVQCCLKGCENEAGSRKFESMVGRYELKCAPDDVTSENLKDLRVCDKDYSSLSARGHKPPNPLMMMTLGSTDREVVSGFISRKVKINGSKGSTAVG